MSTVAPLHAPVHFTSLHAQTHIKITCHEEQFPMPTQTLKDGGDSFEVSVRKAATGSSVVLFSVGSGGQPERLSTLLDALTESGCTVVAPHFERLASTTPTEEELTLRARRLALALDAFVEPSAKAIGVGHSIGAATLVAMAGGQMWLGPGRCVRIAPDRRLGRLALLAPPTGFFQAPAALDAVRIPILAWVGSADSITPPAQTEWFARAMHDWNAVDVRITEGAGHFSFMDVPPPHTTEPLPNKQAFLREYSSEICKFVGAAA
ncbi:pimeloyl-ACP methyl ester carboxylesterase [Variovorax paradoxus]|uniref:alpha/beta fold hydrolase n=1 Tax=Variovorax paradoxus TaxID=34073 RepID=UPI00277DD662|nr:alpha/beta hydrolase [Variovorax paradoxus]MDQ0024555.1 pimeloyl-ACP methyl ester carboxylesterase [Variovorax paradoxus]